MTVQNQCIVSPMITKKQRKVMRLPHIQFQPGRLLNAYLLGRAEAWGLSVHEAAKRAAVMGGLAFDCRHHSLLEQLAAGHLNRDQPFVAATMDAAKLIAGAEEEQRVRLKLDVFSLSPYEKNDALKTMLTATKAGDLNAVWELGSIA